MAQRVIGFFIKALGDDDLSRSESKFLRMEHRKEITEKYSEKKTAFV
jgi:hypothetical protein